MNWNFKNSIFYRLIVCTRMEIWTYCNLSFLNFNGKLANHTYLIFDYDITMKRDIGNKIDIIEARQIVTIKRLSPTLECKLPGMRVVFFKMITIFMRQRWFTGSIFSRGSDKTRMLIFNREDEIKEFFKYIYLWNHMWHYHDSNRKKN